MKPNISQNFSQKSYDQFNITSSIKVKKKLSENLFNNKSGAAISDLLSQNQQLKEQITQRLPKLELYKTTFGGLGHKNHSSVDFSNNSNNFNGNITKMNSSVDFKNNNYSKNVFQTQSEMNKSLSSSKFNYSNLNELRNQIKLLKTQRK